MALSWNEIRDRAVQFSREWSDETSEDAEAKSFLDDFFKVFGVTRRRIAVFEKNVKKGDGKDGYIDLLWKGTILVEMKSRGKDLDRAHKQATEYFPGLKDADLPRYILVCDFERFRLYDLETDKVEEFKLKELHKHIRLFAFILGFEAHTYKEQDPVNIQAAELMGKLHDALLAIGYTGHDLEVFLVRLLFCLFADDTGIFTPVGIFQEYIKNRTSEDGSDLAAKLDELFQVLNQPESTRFKNLDEDLAQFPYVNGKLFSERLRTASFNATMRTQLLNCGALDWSKISPAIFGALFQSIMDDKARRNIGAHYTSEKNILKLIRPLFLDELWDEFKKLKRTHKKLPEFHAKLRSLKFLDPACGCGNFLVITYRELRLLELEVLRALRETDQLNLDLREVIKLDVDQFYGIEIEEFPAQIAQVALWLMDHQMNTIAGQEFGQWFARIPLRTSATIVNDNALRLDWKSVIQPEALSFILGNPPFIGKQFQTAEQKADLEYALQNVKATGVLDFVAGWYVKAAHYIQRTRIICAFVSTNSITQGEQVAALWGELLKLGIRIHFAHRTFDWRNEARGVAAVHCVIIGFADFDTDKKTIFDYSDINGEPLAIQAKNINPYLVDASSVVLSRRSFPLCNAPTICYGSKPADGGALIMSEEEKEAFIVEEPGASKYIRRFVGADELLYGYQRWCLWLKNAEPAALRKLPKVMERIERVRKLRSESKKAATRVSAETPTLFAEDRQGITDFLAMPEVSSERRKFLPIGYMPADTIASNLLYVIPKASVYTFGVLTSTMHMAWVRAVSGRLESRYRYSAGIVYNNFPWPVDATEKQKKAIEAAAQKVLDAREQFPDSSLADLYDPLTMPPVLVKAHQTLDKAVDAAYGKRTFTSDADREAFLFEQYQKLVSPLMVGDGKSKKATQKK
jgi:hypothetical protein